MTRPGAVGRWIGLSGLLMAAAALHASAPPASLFSGLVWRNIGPFRALIVRLDLASATECLCVRLRSSARTAINRFES